MQLDIIHKYLSEVAEWLPYHFKFLHNNQWVLEDRTVGGEILFKWRLSEEPFISFIIYGLYPKIKEFNEFEIALMHADEDWFIHIPLGDKDWKNKIINGNFFEAIKTIKCSISEDPDISEGRRNLLIEAFSN